MALKLTLDEQRALKAQQAAAARIQRMQAARQQQAHIARTKARAFRYVCELSEQQLQVGIDVTALFIWLLGHCVMPTTLYCHASFPGHNSLIRW